MRSGVRSYNDYICPLELDAPGIMIQPVMSLQEANDIVNTYCFHPVGCRPLDGNNADGKYCQKPLKEYPEQANWELTSSDLKDNYGGKHIRIKRHLKCSTIRRSVSSQSE